MYQPGWGRWHVSFILPCPTVKCPVQRGKLTCWLSEGARQQDDKPKPRANQKAQPETLEGDDTSENPKPQPSISFPTLRQSSCPPFPSLFHLLLGGAASHSAASQGEQPTTSTGNPVGSCTLKSMCRAGITALELVISNLFENTGQGFHALVSGELLSTSSDVLLSILLLGRIYQH